MSIQICDYKLPSGDRSKQRESLINCFLKERAGTGKGDYASRYQYNVEIYGEYGIYLKRPTQLNKGFYFTVNVKGMKFKKKRKYSNPSHNDIINDLESCNRDYPNEYIYIKEAIRSIYECENPDLSHINAFYLDFDNKKHPIQVIILAIKWLFMEQDCAYWNYSGRKKLFESLAESGLV